jgi:crossover junction endodeoxyribonuclease RusA
MIVIELPFPSAVLNPNRARGRKWQARIRAEEAARDDAYFRTYDVIATCARPHYVTCVELEFCAPDARKRDLDNLLSSMKPALDGIARALGINDADFHTITVRRGETCRGGKVIVRIK